MEEMEAAGSPEPVIWEGAAGGTTRHKEPEEGQGGYLIYVPLWEPTKILVESEVIAMAVG